MQDTVSFLFARPSFIEGFGRMFDFAGAMNRYNKSANVEEADMIAMEADWTAIANDITEAFKRFEQGERE